MRNKAFIVLVATAGTALMAGLALGEREAAACGGCFNPPENPTVVTDHRMIFSISQQQSTLYDEIKYSGSPSAFGWVLPYQGDETNPNAPDAVTVGVSSDIVFTALDGATQTQIIAPPTNCPPPPDSCRSFNAGAAADTPSAAPPGVQVLKTEVVGPFGITFIKASGADSLQKWLTDNGFNLPPEVVSVVDAYQTGGFKFIAVKLQPGQGVQDMRPIRVTTKGANVALPLRMVAAGTGPTVGVTLWVLGDGRYEPSNFPTFVIKSEDLTWNWGTGKSDYTDIRAAKTSAGNGKIWEVESSTIYYRQQLESVIRNGSYNPNGPQPATDDARAAQDYLEEPAPNDAGAPKTAAEVRNEDIDTLFYGIGTATSRVTRLRADLAHAALATDLSLQAAGDQGTVALARTVTKSVGQPACPIYNGCEQTGTTTATSTPAATGSGSGKSTFACATTPRSEPAWLAIGLGFAGIAAAHAARRRRKP